MTTYWKELTELEAEQTSLELQRTRLAERTNMSVAGCKESILERLIDLGKSQEWTLSAILDRYRTTLRGPMDAAARERREHMLNQVLRMYGNFDVDAFESDCDELAIERNEDIDAQKELARLNGRLGQVVKKLKTLREEVVECFHEVPIKWRTYRRQSDDRHKEEMAERIIRHFARDWRTRAPLYECPVTVTGFAIHTLPHHKRQNAQEAYELMGLHSLKRKPYFKFHVSHEPEIEGADAPVETFNAKEKN